MGRKAPHANPLNQAKFAWRTTRATEQNLRTSLQVHEVSL
jgi:hypothetical protein